jgi:hypothetical protein
MDRLMLDGNAVAGLLQEVFAVEMTTVIGTCATCGAARAVGMAHVYRGAAPVLRCSNCGAVLARIVSRESVACVDLSGFRAMDVFGGVR